VGHVIGLLILILGGVHLLFPGKIQRILKASYGDSPFVRNESDLTARDKFLRFFGVIWFLLG
jgi:hypothetical protein